ncbi:MAG: hypothetical protein PHV25_02925 [Candidatus Pacebacteria bacterium]|nr:hypothetical protein [Candidatus Paceibacterota bacterium]
MAHLKLMSLITWYNKIILSFQLLILRIVIGANHYEDRHHYDGNHHNLLLFLHASPSEATIHDLSFIFKICMIKYNYNEKIYINYTIGCCNDTCFYY